MAEIPVSTVVNVSITTTPTAPSRAGFGTLLFATTEAGVPFYEGVRYYSTIDEVADDWADTTEAYIAANTYFSQSPRPTRLAIGSIYASAQAGLLIGGGNAETDPAEYADINNGSFVVSINGSSSAITGCDFYGVTTMAGVATILQTKIRAVGTGGFTSATVAWDGTKFTITSGTTGASSSVSVLSDHTTGTDLAAMLDCDAGNGTPYVGIAAESTITPALNRFQAASTDWYALALDKALRDSSDAELAAAWCEARVKQCFLATNDATTLDSATESDMAFALNAAGYRRSFVIYSSKPAQYPEVSAFGRAATTNFSASNSVITLKFKQLPGITTEAISSAQLSTLTSKGCNAYVSIGGVNILTEGIMSAGLGVYQDTVHGVDWLQNAVETNVYSFLVTRTTKVPLTDEGVAQLASRVTAALSEAVNNGLVAPGTTFDGEYLDTGFLVEYGKVADLSISDRQQRKSPAITFTAIGAGAIHGVTINGTFEA